MLTVFPGDRGLGMSHDEVIAAAVRPFKAVTSAREADAMEELQNQVGAVQDPGPGSSLGYRMVRAAVSGKRI